MANETKGQNALNRIGLGWARRDRQRRVSSGKRVKAGRLFLVINKWRRGSSKENYVFTLLEGSAGKEEPYLFTDAQLRAARERAVKNPEDCLRKKRFFIF